MTIRPIPPKDDPLWQHARAFQEQVEARWREAGKALPSDFPLDSPGFLAAEEALLDEMIRALGGDPEHPELDLGSLGHTEQ